jgi:hypothetical protein
MEVSSAMMWGIISVVGVPVLLWGARVYWMTKRCLDGHGDTNKLVVTLTGSQQTIHRENMSSARSTRYALRELSHYVRWDTEQRTGKKPPPYVANGDE